MSHKHPTHTLLLLSFFIVASACSGGSSANPGNGDTGQVGTGNVVMTVNSIDYDSDQFGTGNDRFIQDYLLIGITVQNKWTSKISLETDLFQVEDPMGVLRTASEWPLCSGDISVELAPEGIIQCTAIFDVEVGEQFVALHYGSGDASGRVDISATVPERDVGSCTLVDGGFSSSDGACVQCVADAAFNGACAVHHGEDDCKKDCHTCIADPLGLEREEPCQCSRYACEDECGEAAEAFTECLLAQCPCAERIDLE